MMRTIAVLAGLLFTTSAAYAAVDLNAAAVGSGPYYLDQAGTTYRLLEDVAVPGSAFVFAANNVTLDLNGHTVTFGMSPGAYRYGVAVPPPYPHANRVWAESDIRVWAGATGAVMKNGRVVQGAGRADSCGAVTLYAQNSVTITGLDILIFGDDTYAIRGEESSNCLIYSNTITDSTQVVTNRHQGRAAIDLLAMADGPVEIFNNTLHNCRQWGIRVGRRRPVTVWGHIYNNQINLNTIVVNGYGVEVYSDLMEVYGNTIRATNGRGIHLDGSMSPRIHDNDIIATERSTGEYNRAAAHGIKLENCNDADVYGNTVLSYGVTDIADQQSLGSALSLSLGANTVNHVHDNRFTALHLGGAAFRLEDYGNYATPIELFEADPTAKITIENNVFSSNDRMFAAIAWLGPDGQPAPGENIVLRGNTFLRNNGGVPTGRPEMLVIGSNFSNLVFQDCTYGAGVDLHRFTPGWPWMLCSWSVGWSGTARVVDPEGSAVAGATVSAVDVSGTTVTSAITDASGSAPLALPMFSVSTSGEPYEHLDRVVEHNPYVLQATVGGSTVQATATPSAPGGSWTLTTDGGTVDPPPPPPVTPPGVGDFGWAFQVLTTSPSAGPASAPPGAELRWMFNEPVSLGSLNSGTLAVVGSTTGLVAGQIDLGLNGRLVIFRPASLLAVGETITARLSGVVRSASGHYLDGNRDGRTEGSDADAFTLIFAVSD